MTSTTTRRTGQVLLLAMVLAACAAVDPGARRSRATAPAPPAAGAPPPPGDLVPLPAPATGATAPSTPSGVPAPGTRVQPTDRVILAAGDIAKCTDAVDEATAAIVRSYPSAGVLTPGDMAYPDGSAQDYASCYGPSWGVFRARTRTAPGNHEYRTAGASAYFAYFGSRAGTAGQGWYSFDLGTWHVVALNSNCADVGCYAGSAQERWLRADLWANRNHRCTLAFFHHPLYSSGMHGPTPEVRDLFVALHAYRVDVVLNAHDHNYERFALQDADGRWHDAGVRQFVVGTGGGDRRDVGTPAVGSVARGTYPGVLLMTLRTGSYDWRFLSVPAGGYADTGLARCV